MHPCIYKNMEYTAAAPAPATTTKQITQTIQRSVSLPLFLSAWKTKQNQNQIAKFIAFVDKSIISMHTAKLYLYTFSVSIVRIVYLVCCVHMCTARSRLCVCAYVVLCRVQNINLQRAALIQHAAKIHIDYLLELQF